MRRPFTISSFALAVALAPAVLFAQATPPAQQPPTQPPAGQAPAGQPPAAQPAAPEKPAGPKLTFKGSAGMLLVQVKPDQTAAFEEMITKLKTSTGSATDPQVKQQSQVKAYRSAEPAPGGNAGLRLRRTHHPRCD